MKENFYKNNMINKIYDMKAEELAQEKLHKPNKEKDNFLDIVEKVRDPNLKQRLKDEYLKADDEFGIECGRLIKHYYSNGFVDGVFLIIDCLKYTN